MWTRTPRILRKKWTGMFLRKQSSSAPTIAMETAGPSARKTNLVHRLRKRNRRRRRNPAMSKRSEYDQENQWQIRRAFRKDRSALRLVRYTRRSKEASASDRIFQTS